MTDQPTITVGAAVEVSGARAFKGRVMALTDQVMVIAIALDQSIYLRRDPASTAPLQWRYGKLPVAVRAVPARPTDFGDRLKDLERKTRP